MPKLLCDANLAHEMDVTATLLARDEWELEPAPIDRPLRESARAERPDLIVVSDERPDVWSEVEAVRSDGDLDDARILILVRSARRDELTEALAGAGVRVVEGPVDPDRLAQEVANLLNVPTRVAMRAAAVIEIQGGRDPGRTVFSGQILDISTGGFRLRTEERFHGGDVVYCFFTLPDQEATIFSSSRVVRMSPAGGAPFEYGLSFEEIRLDDRRRIAEFVLREKSVRERHLVAC